MREEERKTQPAAAEAATQAPAKTAPPKKARQAPAKKDSENAEKTGNKTAKKPATKSTKGPPRRKSPQPHPDSPVEEETFNELVISKTKKGPSGEEESETTTTCITGSAQIMVNASEGGVAAGKNDHYTADWKQNKLLEQIRKFEEELDDESEIAFRLASFGSTITMRVEYIGFQNPDILYFYGTVKGERAQLIQNMNQLNFLLTAEKKECETKPPRRIGFLQEHREEHVQEA